jgi:hypothetical protein
MISMTKDEAIQIVRKHQVLSVLAVDIFTIYLKEYNDCKYDELQELITFDSIIDPYFYCNVHLPYQEDETVGLPLDWLFIEDAGVLDSKISGYIADKKAEEERIRIQSDLAIEAIKEESEKALYLKLKKKYENK